METYEINKDTVALIQKKENKTKDNEGISCFILTRNL